MQYEYFKIDDDKWLEVTTLNKKSISRILHISEEVTENDTILWMGLDSYDSGFYVFLYNKLDTLPKQSIIQNKVKY